MSSNAEASVLIPPPIDAPNYKLFDANAVGLATFFGTPIAGCLLMALNYHRLGQMGRAVMTLLVGTLVTGLVLLVTWNLPSGANVPIAIALLVVTRLSADKLQGRAVKEHVARGGQLASRWSAFWVSLIFLAIFFGIVLVIVYQGEQRTGVMIGTKDEVFYSGSATSAEAQALGNALKEIGYFKDRGANVMVDKGKDGTVVSFVVADGTWDKPDMVAAFEKIARGEAQTVGGLPITLRLVNTEMDVEKSEVLK